MSAKDSNPHHRLLNSTDYYLQAARLTPSHSHVILKALTVFLYWFSRLCSFPIQVYAVCTSPDRDLSFISCFGSVSVSAT